MKSTLRCVTIVSILGASCVYADDLTDLLTETTELATKTKLNTDYTPGTISVIRGFEMKALGIQNLADPNAFDMIVGFDTASSSARGTGADYGAYGQAVKWMVNGKEYSNQVVTPSNWATNRVVLPIPIDFVDKIEVIRGPGSSLYGGNAVFGIVNIVTKQDLNGAFIGGSAMESGSFGKNAGGSLAFKGDNYSISANVAGYQSDGYNLNVGSAGHFYSALWNAPQMAGYGPGKLPNGSSGLNAMLDTQVYGYKAWIYQSQISSAQGAFGAWVPNLPLPPSGNNYMLQTSNTNFGVEKEFKLTDTLKITPKLSYLQMQTSANNFYYMDARQSTVNIPGLISNKYSEGQKIAQLDGEYKLLESHLVNLGVYYNITNNLQDAQTNNYNSGVCTMSNGICYFTPQQVNSTFWPSNNMSLINRAAYIQDQYAITDALSVTYGIRYDSYAATDIQKYQAVSPRVAGVWIIDKDNIVKAQYSRAFRPPTMQDFSYNGTNTLKPETVDTFELGYIFKHLEHTLKPTVFYSKMYNVINYNGGSGYTQNFAATESGAELEYKYLHSWVSLNANGAYYKTHTPAFIVPYLSYPANQFEIAPSVLANAWVTILPSSDYPTTLWIHYIGQQMINNNFSFTGFTPSFPLVSSNIPAQNYVNITQQFKSIIKGADLSIGISDVFNTTMQALRMPLEYFTYNGGTNNQAVPYMGRSFWANLVYKF